MGSWEDDVLKIAPDAIKSTLVSFRDIFDGVQSNLEYYRPGGTLRIAGYEVLQGGNRGTFAHATRPQNDNENRPAQRKTGYLRAAYLLLHFREHSTQLSRMELDSDPIVDLGFARYRGQQSSARCTVYLGIPYAQPPLGDLRFRCPKPLDTSGVATGVTNATQYPMFAIQGATGEFVQYEGFFNI